MFGAEFLAMKIVMENLRSIRYELRMMGVNIYGPSYIYGYNMSVIHNTHRPEYTLKNKNTYIFNRAVCDSVPMVDSLTGHVSTN